MTAGEFPDNKHPDKPQRTYSDMLLECVMGFRSTQVIAVAAKLQLIEHLNDGINQPELLARKINMEPSTLFRLLRALVSLGILKTTDGEIFDVTPLGDVLDHRSPGSIPNIAMLYGEEWLWKAYAHLSISIETAKPSFEETHGATFYSYLSNNSTAAKIFNSAMSDFSKLEANAVRLAVDFSRVRNIVDLGGGTGAFLTALLETNPHVRGVVFDLIDVIRSIEVKPTEQISYEEGSFFSTIPPGADMYILKSVLHNWNDELCIPILKNILKSMLPDSRLLIIERVIPDDFSKSEAALFDINMMVVTGGRERSLEDYTVLIRTAGLSMIRLINTSSYMSILECRPNR